MLTKEFTYTLPKSSIASYPSDSRTGSRLMHFDRATGVTTDGKFIDILKYLRAGDLLVLNTSKVFPARLWGRKETGGKVELLVERVINDTEAWVHLKSNHATKVGTWLVFKDDIRAQVCEIDTVARLFRVSFHNEIPLNEILEDLGEMPLPPYMGRQAETSDIERYQTVYADSSGSVAAPTAGLHFDQKTLFLLKNKGIEIGKLILHVGAGTFRPVQTENATEHQMHSEYVEVSQTLCEQIIATRARGGRVICVGTTSVRALETAALRGKLQPYSGETQLFITPGFEFKVADGLLTNFHLPGSTLLMLVSAFAGQKATLAAYEQAIAWDYRFYSYGDAMLILDPNS